VRLTLVEVRAAVAAARRAGRTSAAGLRAAKSELARRWAALAVVELDADLAAEAADAAELHRLRSHDAVQLAAGRRARGVFVTWDADLRRAAVDAGLAVVPA
jgi:predicted nucleic acid-binding protein